MNYWQDSEGNKYESKGTPMRVVSQSFTIDGQPATLDQATEAYLLIEKFDAQIAVVNNTVREPIPGLVAITQNAFLGLPEPD